MIDSLVLRFLACARQYPTVVAVEFRGELLSYRELELWSRAVARNLRTRGIEPGMRVGVQMARSLNLVPTLLAGC